MILRLRNFRNWSLRRPHFKSCEMPKRWCWILPTRCPARSICHLSPFENIIELPRPSAIPGITKDAHSSDVSKVSTGGLWGLIWPKWQGTSDQVDRWIEGAEPDTLYLGWKIESMGRPDRDKAEFHSILIYLNYVINQKVILFQQLLIIPLFGGLSPLDSIILLTCALQYRLWPMVSIGQRCLWHHCLRWKPAPCEKHCNHWRQKMRFAGRPSGLPLLPKRSFCLFLLGVLALNRLARQGTAIQKTPALEHYQVISDEHVLWISVMSQTFPTPQ